MVTTEAAQRQFAMEDNLLRICAGGVPQDRPVGETFGPVEAWSLDVAGRRLFLNPLLCEWFLWDSLHGSWERTGFAAGEAVFVPFGKGIGARMRVPPGSSPPSLFPAPPQVEDRWYFREGALQIGPFSRKALEEKLAKGQIGPDTPVKKAGTVFWRRADWVVPAADARTDAQPLRAHAPPAPPSPPPVRAPTPPKEEVPTYDRTVELLPLSLVVEEGPQRDQRFTLIKGGNLGRQEGNEIVLEDGNVSRKHAAFTQGEEGAWYVTDLGSINGTWVNGSEIKEPALLKGGDLIQVGSTVLRFVTG